MNHETPTHPFHLPQLDALRFFAFLAVFAHHALPHDAYRYELWGFGKQLSIWLSLLVKGGGFGLDLFFVLSSFLITELLLREREQYGQIDIRSFLIRRALRIWPLYFAFLMLAWLVIPRFTREHLDGTYVMAFAIFAGNWICAFQRFPFSSATPLWSVSIEWQFYLCWPFVIRKLGEGGIPLTRSAKSCQHADR